MLDESPEKSLIRFLPDAVAARRCDARMHADLADSLRQLLEQLREQIAPAILTRYQAQLNPVLELTESGQRISPGAFAAYYRIVLALLDDHGNADQWFSLLQQCAVPINQLQIRELSVAGLGSQARVSLYQQALDTDDNIRFGFLPPDATASARCRDSIQRGLALMARDAPELVAEFRALVGEILLAAPHGEPGSMRFDGVSSYQLWGALALSVAEIKSDLEMMETLAHEAAHSFLFGLMTHEVLVSNDDSELFSSPLRPDPRPMDGIFHATFVSARMHYAMRSAHDAGNLTPAELVECEGFLAASRKAFTDGYALVTVKAHMTATGRSIMDAAAAYMDNASLSRD